MRYCPPLPTPHPPLKSNTSSALAQKWPKRYVQCVAIGTFVETRIIVATFAPSPPVQKTAYILATKYCIQIAKIIKIYRILCQNNISVVKVCLNVCYLRLNIGRNYSVRSENSVNLIPFVFVFWRKIK